MCRYYLSVRSRQDFSIIPSSRTFSISINHFIKITATLHSHFIIFHGMQKSIFYRNRAIMFPICHIRSVHIFYTVDVIITNHNKPRASITVNKPQIFHVSHYSGIQSIPAYDFRHKSFQKTAIQLESLLYISLFSQSIAMRHM